MRFLLPLVLLACSPLIRGADHVEMAPFRAVPYDVYFAASYDLETDVISEVRVTEVKAGSTVEKLGLRKGDRLISIGGQAVVGRKRSQVLTQSQAISLRGEVTFAGTRGLFRKPWSLTVDTDQLRKSSPKQAPTPAPLPPTTADSAPAVPAPAQP